MSLTWSPQQEGAIKAVRAWLADPNRPQLFRLFGYAGTGKTTLALTLAQEFDGQVVFGAFTGVAASVMRRKGCHGAMTIHSMIYTPEPQEDGSVAWVLNRDGAAALAGLIIIDECSMPGEELARDLMSFGKPILVLGDPFQLPPVKGTGFFTEARPDFMLTEIHRQALENPIVRLSMDIREGSPIHKGDFGKLKIIGRGDITPDVVDAAGMVLVGRNMTRRKYNQRIREIRGFKGAMPRAGETLMCLRNNRPKSMMNGTIWMCDDVRKGKNGRLKMAVHAEDNANNVQKVDVIPDWFTGIEDPPEEVTRFERDQLTFGYVRTVHKAQGAQADDVVLFDESGIFREHAARWLYTGATRSAETLTIVR